MSTSQPIVCLLSNAELRNRRATLLASFKAAVVGTEELADGYRFELTGEGANLSLATDVMLTERECCPFLTFELKAEPGLGPLSLRITGPEGTKEILKSFFE